ncbi:MAG TPA: amidohydrolase family protein [Methylomirabilota bacterium]|nr:amidohydrolase family protein [Methylomirabilota bacterium]
MSAAGATCLIRNIGTLVTGDCHRPLRPDDSIFVADGRIREIGTGLDRPADVVIDARGTTALPGLIDSHSHPTFGDFTPAQTALSWITHYLHGGVTALISAGELHLPGLPTPPDPRTALALAHLAKVCWDTLRPGGVKVYGGTLLLVPGLTEDDFAGVAAAGIRLVKFIFYDYRLPTGEAEGYVAWARARAIKVKLHSGGVSRSGVSQVAGAAIVKRLMPDIVAHVTGGPIPMPPGEIDEVVAETDCDLEICSSGNPRMVLHLMRAVRARDAFHRVLVGTDTPGGTGVIPRGMLREIAYLAAVAEVPPELAVAMATGNVARAHGLPQGILEEGRPADLVLLDRIPGSIARDALDAFARGDLPGISTVLIDGQPRVVGRSQQTPPPERPAIIRGPLDRQDA